MNVQERMHMENRPHRNQCYTVGPHRNLVGNQGSHTSMCGHSGSANQKLRGIEYTEGTVGPNPAWLTSRGVFRVENSGQTSCKGAAGSGL